jgi:trehalose-phosphatase
MNGRSSIPQHLPDSTALKQIEAAAKVVLFLDYDGTLVSFQSKPEDAKPSCELERLLQELVKHVDVCIVTGRRLDDITSLLTVDGLWFAGVHGAEVQMPAGKRLQWLQCDIEDTVEVRRILESCLTFEGVWVEDKEYALAVHYRRNPAAGEQVLEIVQGVCGGFEGLEVLQGDMVVEVRVEGCNKGVAVEKMLHSFFSGALPVYLGDDRTDEDAFLSLREGITVAVFRKPRSTHARYYLFDWEVLPFLAALLATRTQPS